MANTILHGSDLPKSQKTIKVKVIKARRAPDDWKTKFILDIEPVLDGRNAWPVNKNNTAVIRAEFGGLQKCEGKTLELTKTEPQRDFPAGLEITGIVQQNGKVRQVSAVALDGDDDIPF